MMHTRTRKVEESDLRAIADVVLAAFGPAEGEQIVQLIADLSVDASAQPVRSLVATLDDRLVGYILFTRARVDTAEREVSAALLAPLAVHPDFQSQPIGDQLVREGLRQLAEADVDLVFVLGHPEYYPRFGFAPAGIRGFEAPYPIPPSNAGAWMVLGFRPGIVAAVAGQVRCADALDDPQYWRE
ncbi:MAG: GNAT family N-acetyltransferase [Gammaproteobacteria bacterium]